ncbi:MAG: radical SAM family heme chaperone HemW [Clostridia bacterium]|nr:radical SAM family heme chaperone HemW [Clostridia bacterium]
MRSLGIYLHIPFCVQKCNYCDFCSFAGADASLFDAYTAELCRRIEAKRGRMAEYLVNTVYFGGGTPTLLSAEQLSRVMDTLRRSCHISEDCEITCECNPATADLKTLREMRKMGINRLSIGLQSVHDEELRRLGRIHSYEDFLATFADARAAGFDNISVDLMYALPEQSLASFEQSLKGLAELSPEHISVYGLKIEDDTPFARMRFSLILPDEEEEYEMYLACTRILEAYGYRKYEISNFAKLGRESRHNLRYWHGEEYLGFGVAAHSFFAGERFGHTRDISAFLRGEEIVEERIHLDAHELQNEYLMLRLRLREGIDRSEFYEKFGSPLPSLDRWIEGGWMEEREGCVFFTDAGFFVSNAILSELLDFEQN